MPMNFGGWVTRLIDKGTATVSLKARQSVTKAARDKLNRQAYQYYRSIYFGDVIHASMTDVVQALESYVQMNLFGWRPEGTALSADGKVGQFRYVLDFQETFILGQFGCPMKPRTAMAGVKVSLLQNNNQTEAVTVPYRGVLTVSLGQRSDYVAVRVAIQEQIDPGNSIHYLRSGLFSAPSLLDVRCGHISSNSITEYLHNACRDYPEFQAWYDESGRKIPEIAATAAELQQAETELECAKQNLLQLK